MVSTLPPQTPPSIIELGKNSAAFTIGKSILKSGKKSYFTTGIKDINGLNQLSNSLTEDWNYYHTFFEKTKHVHKLILGILTENAIYSKFSDTLNKFHFCQLAINLQSNLVAKEKRIEELNKLKEPFHNILQFIHVILWIYNDMASDIVSEDLQNMQDGEDLAASIKAPPKKIKAVARKVDEILSTLIEARSEKKVYRLRKPDGKKNCNRLLKFPLTKQELDLKLGRKKNLTLDLLIKKADKLAKNLRTELKVMAEKAGKVEKKVRFNEKVDIFEEDCEGLLKPEANCSPNCVDEWGEIKWHHKWAANLRHRQTAQLTKEFKHYCENYFVNAGLQVSEGVMYHLGHIFRDIYCSVADLINKELEAESIQAIPAEIFQVFVLEIYERLKAELKWIGQKKFEEDGDQPADRLLVSRTQKIVVLNALDAFLADNEINLVECLYELYPACYKPNLFDSDWMDPDETKQSLEKILQMDIYSDELVSGIFEKEDDDLMELICIDEPIDWK